MCPCPNSGKGLTSLILENIKEMDALYQWQLSLFEKNMIQEGAFFAQMQKYSFGADDKVVNQEQENSTMRLVVSDDKIDAVMASLDSLNDTFKSTDFKISPLLRGKAEYMKW